MAEQDVFIGEIRGCKVFLKWDDVKEICTDAVSEGYEQLRVENAGIKKENEEISFQLKNCKEEYEKECRRADELEDSYWKAEKENAKLKALLKECKQWFDWYHIDTGTGKEYIESWHKKGHEIHAKINEVLK